MNLHIAPCQAVKNKMGAEAGLDGAVLDNPDAPMEDQGGGE